MQTGSIESKVEKLDPLWEKKRQKTFSISGIYWLRKLLRLLNNTQSEM
jgi:hypothetical protein